jgi:hypothetical protein
MFESVTFIGRKSLDMGGPHIALLRLQRLDGL